MILKQQRKMLLGKNLRILPKMLQQSLYKWSSLPILLKPILKHNNNLLPPFTPSNLFEILFFKLQAD